MAGVPRGDYWISEQEGQPTLGAGAGEGTQQWQVWGGPGSGGCGGGILSGMVGPTNSYLKIGRLEFSYFESEARIQSDLAVSLL